MRPDNSSAGQSIRIALKCQRIKNVCQLSAVLMWLTYFGRHYHFIYIAGKAIIKTGTLSFRPWYFSWESKMMSTVA
jgi:hypothetical protein